MAYGAMSDEEDAPSNNADNSDNISNDAQGMKRAREDDAGEKGGAKKPRLVDHPAPPPAVPPPSVSPAGCNNLLIYHYVFSTH